MGKFSGFKSVKEIKRSLAKIIKKIGDGRQKIG